MPGDATHLQNATQNTASSYTTLELFYTGARLVDVKRTDNDKARISCEVVKGNGNLGANVFNDSIDVEFELGRDGDYGSVACNGC